MIGCASQAFSNSCCDSLYVYRFSHTERFVSGRTARDLDLVHRTPQVRFYRSFSFSFLGLKLCVLSCRRANSQSLQLVYRDYPYSPRWPAKEIAGRIK
jgi:hypothetical protein